VESIEDRKKFCEIQKQKKLHIYDKAWKEALDQIKINIDFLNKQFPLADPKIIIGMVLDKINFDEYEGFIPAWITDHFVIDYDNRFNPTLFPYRLNVLNGKYVSVPIQLPNLLLFEIISKYIDPEVDCLVEFGSGLGINLIKMFLRSPNANLCYVACEPSENGLITTQKLFSIVPNINLEIQYFDFNQNNLDFLKKFRKIVGFTCHAIEQVTILGDTFYNQLLDTNIHAFIHCEPIGWQRLKICDLLPNIYSTKSENKFKFIVDDDYVLSNAAVWASASEYNMDLLAQIFNFEKRGEIEITDIYYDFVGTNPFNPASLISWIPKNRNLKFVSKI